METNTKQGKVMAMILLLLCTIPLTAAWGVNEMIGPGRWMVMKLIKCPDDDKYPVKFDISRKKVNRTHDGFNLYTKLDFTLDDRYGVFIDACKYMDGGCKPFQKFQDDCACCFLKKYGGTNMEDIFSKAGFDPPECPLPAGEIKLIDYVFDYGELPEKGIYGTYDAKVYINGPKDSKKMADQLGCIVVTVRFEKNDDGHD